MNNLRSTDETRFMRIIKEEECNSSSSSSIGNNSDDDDNDDGDDAQSPYRFDHENNNKISTGSLDDAIQAIEKALPIRRGISTFYDGKSKSFTCLANMWHSSTPSINDIAKPENAFDRKRRTLLASTLLSHKNKNRAFQLSNINMGRISKKPKTATFHFASEKEDTDIQNPNLSSMRSFSMVNLHRCSSRFGLKSTEIENC
ncbi:hypothetical protein M8C21_023279 [Ambrosia artemisiifolia]|uniref:Uncharacterized protein n=1 Tax=Ambrosia artemisiifolia TaxID=4212 RepID=A0AAD5C0Z8_AMBAR|nr:hypothetical protein M8C21_023279 [Ambrosia artemisiifolia]